MKKTLLTFIILASVLSGCKKDDASDEASFTAKINGELFEASKISKGYISQSSSLGQQRFDVTAENDKNSFNLAFLAYEISDKMPLGTYDGENALVFFNYILSNGSTVMEHDPTDDNGNSVITVVVTQCDGKTISGTFSGTYQKMGVLQDEIDTPDVVEITNGKFTNIPYIVVSGQ